MDNLPTLYEYYTTPSVTSGLSADDTYFTLNNKNITLYSGAMHYFRVPKDYWRDRLWKMRAAGLNAVETYIPWNMHEPEEGVYNFEDGLDVSKFLKTAMEEDLFAIVRPGPYICSEWDFGGMPSWLLRYPDAKLRTSNGEFMDFVSRYFKVLFDVLSGLQFTRGGPIIAFQIENEYGNVKYIDTDYLEGLKNLFIDNGLVELYFTSDTPSNGNDGSLPGILYTANFQNDTTTELDLLKEYQPDRPFMVMEYWSGWFDHWGQEHHTRTTSAFENELELILSYPASVNFYMFHGGTSWGFMNGANVLDKSTDNGGLSVDTSSYDYDAPLSEAGDYTEKYWALKSAIAKHNQVKTYIPKPPSLMDKIAYPTIRITHQITLRALIRETPCAGTYQHPESMELLDINNKSGQSYGYIIYRKTNIDIPKNSRLMIKGRVCDTLMVLINGELKSKIPHTPNDLNTFGYWKVKDAAFTIPGDEDYNNATLDLVVENWGRNNFGTLDQFNQKKGLWQGDVYLNETVVKQWDVYPLEFKRNWIDGLKSSWKAAGNQPGPTLYKSMLVLEERPEDTFVDMRDWVKGIVVVNGFVLSRYFRLGPQQTAYLPAPFLKEGVNEILIFEHFKRADFLSFSDVPVFETVKKF